MTTSVRRCRCLATNLFSGAFGRALFSASQGNFLPTAHLSSATSSITGGSPTQTVGSAKGLLVEFSGNIPVERLEIRYSRSSGPGGQHVNKTNSKVDVRFKVEDADWLPDWIRQRLLVRESSKLTSDGCLIVTSDKTRKQMLNQADCIDKIRRMIVEASRLPKEPTPEEIAIRERRRRLAEIRRLADRRHHSQIKHGRSGPSATED